MSLISLDLKPKLTVPLCRDLRPIRLRVRYDNMGRGLLPGRGLVCSFLTHASVVALLLLWPIDSYRNLQAMPVIEQTSEVIYLPNLGGGSEGRGHRGDGSRTQSKAPSDTPAQAVDGFSYPGPQAIVSDPPSPTNKIQTILRPTLKNIPILRSFVPVPNIVRLPPTVALPAIADNAEPSRPLPQLLPVKPETRASINTKPATIPDVQPTFAPTLPRIADRVQPARPLATYSQIQPKLPAPSELPQAIVPTVQPLSAPTLPKVVDNAEPVRPSPVLSELKPNPPAPTDLKSAKVPNVQPASMPVVPRLAGQTQAAPPSQLFSQLNPKTPSATDVRSPEPVLSVAQARTTAVELDRLGLPAAEKPKMPPLPEMGAPKPGGSTSREDLRTIPDVPAVPSRTTDLDAVLALSPSPTAPQQQVSIPAGESRGRFAISPEPNSAVSKSQPGSQGGSSHSPALAVGSVADTAAGNVAALGPTTVTDTGSSRLRTGAGSGSGASTDSRSGSAKDESGSENGRGSRAGIRLGEGPGVSSGTGAGAGAGKSAGAFAGMTIQGGVLEGADVNTSVSSARVAVAPNAVYGMTIVSTASSGGGLPDFGVFTHEQVYTVYVDMRRTVDDPAPVWTLQCALLLSTDPQDANSSNDTLNGLVPPFALTKEPPNLPADIVRQYLGKQIVIYGVIDKSGRFGHMEVEQAPDVRLNQPILDQLSRWVFRPAELNGTPVAVKALLGFSLSLPQP